MQGLIRPEEADGAQINTIRTELADFETEWCRFEVLQDRFNITTEDPRQYGPLRDLAIGIFTILPHTPIQRFGVTRIYHFRADSLEQWHAFGHTLAPKACWDSILEKPGLRSMQMWGSRKGSERGAVSIKIEPSLVVVPGVYVEVTEEYRGFGPEQVAAKFVPTILSGNWDDILNYSDAVVANLFALVNTP